MNILCTMPDDDLEHMADDGKIGMHCEFCSRDFTFDLKENDIIKLFALADEIVDTFHNYNKEELFDKFETDLNEALKYKISLNPILNLQRPFHH